MKVILASSSPRRKQLLEKIVDSFEICTNAVDESSTQTDPQKLVEQLSLQKAKAVEKHNSDNLVIGCDTVVSFQGRIFGKPQSVAEAYSMLRELSGNVHEVFTGVTILFRGIADTFVEVTKVKFRNLSDEDINSYIKSRNCFDKAGAYGIQETDFVSSIVGSYYNIMGLPIEALSKHLESFQVRCKQLQSCQSGNPANLLGEF